MEKDVFWFIFVLIALFFGPFNHGRYQTTGMGARVLVLDKTTGEAWVSVETSEWLNPAKMELAPVKYSSDGQWSFVHYTPEATRNDKNADWSTWFGRKLEFGKKNPGDI